MTKMVVLGGEGGGKLSGSSLELRSRETRDSEPLKLGVEKLCFFFCDLQKQATDDLGTS